MHMVLIGGLCVEHTLCSRCTHNIMSLTAVCWPEQSGQDRKGEQPTEVWPTYRPDEPRGPALVTWCPLSQYSKLNPAGSQTSVFIIVSGPPSSSILNINSTHWESKNFKVKLAVLLWKTDTSLNISSITMLLSVSHFNSFSLSKVIHSCWTHSVHETLTYNTAMLCRDWYPTAHKFITFLAFKTATWIPVTKSKTTVI